MENETISQFTFALGREIIYFLAVSFYGVAD